MTGIPAGSPDVNVEQKVVVIGRRSRSLRAIEVIR